MASSPRGGLITQERRKFHASLLVSILTRGVDGVVSIADSKSKTSCAIADGIYRRVGASAVGARLVAQMSGKRFEELVARYIEAVFPKLSNLRPGKFSVGGQAVPKGKRKGRAIADFDQYSHLASLRKAAKADPTLAVAIGQDYLIKPDVIVVREPEPDHYINQASVIVDMNSARRTSIRSATNAPPTLHAVISCKWTMRSDRSQNARSEALNLIRNRKGRLPHIVVVAGEPMPSRLASLAYGTGDLDCVYHFALDELVDTVKALGFSDAEDALSIMIEGKRLRDISDLPLDLTI